MVWLLTGVFWMHFCSCSCCDVCIYAFGCISSFSYCYRLPSWWNKGKYIDTARIVCVEQGLCGGRASLRPPVRLSVPSIKSNSGVRGVCCWAPCEQEISVDSCGRAAGNVLQHVPALSSNGAAARRSAANAGSVTLTADEGGWTQTCLYLI